MQYNLETPPKNKFDVYPSFEISRAFVRDRVQSSCVV